MRTIVIAGALVAAALSTSAEAAAADLIVKQPNAHPDYKVELEPHGDLVFIHPGYAYHGGGVGGPYSGAEFGAGFRATIELVDPGFVSKLNDTVGITFGIDATNCHRCVANKGFSLWTPVGLQWNFFLTKEWSVFAEAGPMLTTSGFYHDVYFDYFAMLGGRYHFADKTTLTIRLGYPFLGVGVSFLAG